MGPAKDHVYYVHALSYDMSETAVTRETIVQALKAELPVTELREGEGTLVNTGYIKPLYLMSMYQEMIGMGSLFRPALLKSADPYGLKVGIVPIKRLEGLVDARDEDGLWLAEQYLAAHASRRAKT